MKTTLTVPTNRFPTAPAKVEDAHNPGKDAASHFPIFKSNRQKQLATPPSSRTPSGMESSGARCILGRGEEGH